MKILSYDLVDSTQSLAKDKFDGSEDLLILADRQRAGRGRYGRSFFSPEGGLYFTWTYRADRPTTAITPLVGLSSLEALEAKTGKKLQIKWVNDLLLDGKKVAGILCEAKALASGLGYGIFCGVGINLDDPEERPEEDLPYMGNLGLQLSREEKKALALDVVDRVRARLDQEPATWMGDYAKRLYGLGEEAYLSDGSSGILQGVDDLGQLLVQTDAGLRVYNAGEIRLLKKGKLWQ